MTRLALLLTAAVLLSGCGEQPPATPSPEIQALAEQVDSQQWQQQADAGLSEASQHWQQALDRFSERQDGDSLSALNKALQGWYQALNQHYLLLAARACASNNYRTLARLDSWPLYPGYLDSQPDWPDSGLVNDPTLILEARTLRGQHQATDDSEVSLGFQALFVILNGTTTTPRPLSELRISATDSNDDNGDAISASPASRRQQLLLLVSAQLATDIAALGQRPLTRQALDCALRHSVQRQRQADYWLGRSTELGEPEIPAAAAAHLQGALIATLATVPEALFSEWGKDRPGLLAALEQAGEGNRETLDTLFPDTGS